MENKNFSEETKEKLQVYISDLNSFANLFKAYLNECGADDELYTLQKIMKEKIKKLVEILDIEFLKTTTWHFEL